MSFLSVNISYYPVISVRLIIRLYRLISDYQYWNWKSTDTDSKPVTDYPISNWNCFSEARLVIGEHLPVVCVSLELRIIWITPFFNLSWFADKTLYFSGFRKLYYFLFRGNESVNVLLFIPCCANLVFKIEVNLNSKPINCFHMNHICFVKIIYKSFSGSIPNPKCFPVGELSQTVQDCSKIDWQ